MRARARVLVRRLDFVLARPSRCGHEVAAYTTAAAAGAETRARAEPRIGARFAQRAVARAPPLDADHREGEREAATRAVAPAHDGAAAHAARARRRGFVGRGSPRLRLG